MNTIIYCKLTDKGVHSFYMTVGSDEFFLFSQPYRKGVAQYFGRGVFIGDSLNFSKAHNDASITRTMEKLPMYIGYIEKEYGIVVMEKTIKKTAKKAKRKRFNKGCS